MLSCSPKSYSGLLFRRFVSILLFLNMLASPLTARAGTSVNIQTGYFSYSTVDLAFGGLYPLAISRNYQSATKEGAPPFGGPFGPGTSLGMWSMRLGVDGNGNVVINMPATEESTTFGCSGSTCTNADPKSYLKGTVSIVSNQATLQTEDGTNYKFEYPAEKLLSITDRLGKTTTLNYSGNKLTSVVAPNGRGIAFYYTNTSFPIQITSAKLFDNNNPQLSNDNYSVSYTYDSSGNLYQFYNVLHNRTVKGVNSSGQIIDRTAYGITTYGYDGQNHLQTITNPRSIQSIANQYQGCGTGDLNCYNIRSQTRPGTSTSTTSDDVINYYSYALTGCTGPKGCQKTALTVKDTLNSSGRQVTYNYSATNGFMTSTVNSADSSTTTYNYNTTTG